MNNTESEWVNLATVDPASVCASQEDEESASVITISEEDLNTLYASGALQTCIPQEQEQEQDVLKQAITAMGDLASEPSEPSEVGFDLSKRDRTGTVSHQWNPNTRQFEVKAGRELDLCPAVKGYKKGAEDYLELKVEHSGSGHGNIYRANPIGQETSKELSVLEIVDGKARYERDAEGAIFVRVDPFKGKVGFKINTLSTSEHNNGKKEAARPWKLSISGMIGNEPICGRIDLQVFETLRDPNRLKRALKRRAKQEQEEEPFKQEPMSPPAAPTGKRPRREAAARKDKEALALRLYKEYIARLPDAVLDFKNEELAKLVQ